MRPLVVIIFSVLLSGLFFAMAQDGSSTSSGLDFDEISNAKVGLVLSGGGARALAHIGVLREIERHNIRIDYIGGTSMGAVVGALYASGYNVNQIDSIFKSVDIEYLVQKNISRSVKDPLKKINEDRYALMLPFRDFKLSLPNSIVKSQKFYDLIVQLLLPRSGVRDFSKLPIPFYCMATNLENGNAEVLDKGYLPIALAATTAFPTLVAPVERNGKLLIDGGVVDNYPIAEMLEKDVDYIIGVNAQKKLLSKEGIKNGTDVLSQVMGFYDSERIVSKSELTDVFISPNLDKYGLLDFNSRYEIIYEGQRAAKEKEHLLQDIANRQIRNTSDKIEITPPSSLVISGISNPKFDNIRNIVFNQRFKSKLGKTISFNSFSKEISGLLNPNDKKSIYYLLYPDGRNGHTLEVKSLPIKRKTFLKLGLHYDMLYKSAGLINLSQNYLFSNRDNFSLDIVLGDKFRYNVNYTVDTKWLSICLKSNYNTFTTPVFSDRSLSEEVSVLQPINLAYSTFKNQFFLRYYINTTLYMSLGMEHQYLKTSSDSFFLSSFFKGHDYVFENSHFLGLFGSVEADTYDNIYFPKSGYKMNLDLHYYGFSTDYNDNFSPFLMFTFKAGKSVSFFQKLSINANVELGYSFVDEYYISEGDNYITNPLYYRLGGYGNNFVNNASPFYGYNFFELYGGRYLKLGGTVDFTFFKRNHLNISANFANITAEAHYLGYYLSGFPYSGYAFGYGLETPIGPIEIKYGFSPDTVIEGRVRENNQKGFITFNLGYWF